jgi:hypothetical protein
MRRKIFPLNLRIVKLIEVVDDDYLFREFQ